jgi:hypothetical protein
MTYRRTLARYSALVTIASLITALTALGMSILGRRLNLGRPIA